MSWLVKKIEITLLRFRFTKLFWTLFSNQSNINLLVSFQNLLSFDYFSSPILSRGQILDFFKFKVGYVITFDINIIFC